MPYNPAFYELGTEAALAVEKADAYTKLAKKVSDERLGEASQSFPKWFPKTDKIITKWKAVYGVIRDIDIEYRRLFEKLDIDNPKPRLDEYRDAILDSLDFRYGEKTISHIKQAGDNGWLDKPPDP